MKTPPCLPGREQWIFLILHLPSSASSSSSLLPPSAPALPPSTAAAAPASAPHPSTTLRGIPVWGLTVVVTIDIHRLHGVLLLVLMMDRWVLHVVRRSVLLHLLLLHLLLLLLLPLLLKVQNSGTLCILFGRGRAVAAGGRGQK